jgi:hypothetical protein
MAGSENLPDQAEHRWSQAILGESGVVGAALVPSSLLFSAPALKPEGFSGLR